MTGMKLPAEWFELLRPARFRIWMIRGLQRMKRAGWAVIGWVLLVLLTARTVPVAHPGTWAASGGAVLLLLGAAWAALSRPDWPETVRIADRVLGLEDRLNTAWQMREREEAVAALQREDALERLRRQMPLFARATPLVSATRREFWTAAGAVCLAAALFLVPNPLTDQALKQERIRMLVAKRAEEVEKWREAAEKEPGVSKETKEAVRKEFTRLTERLKEARSLEEAALELAKSDERLRQLREQAERRSEPARRLAEEWQTGGLSALGQAMQGGRADERKIAEAIRGLKPEERKKLAEQLDRLAGEWSAAGERQTARAAASLHSAAEALAANAAGAENAAARALAETERAVQAQQADGRLLASGSQALSGGAVLLAGGTRGTAGPADGTPLGGAPSGSGNGNGSESGSGSGTGSSPGNEGQGGNGSGNGRSTGGGQGGNGAGAGGSGAGSGAGGMVLVPWSRLPGEGRRGSLGGSAGEGTETEAGTPSVTPGVLRPYGEVFASYEAEAREALERGEIPPELEWLVREYFSTLEP